MGTARSTRTPTARSPTDRQSVGDAGRLPVAAARARKRRTNSAPAVETSTMRRGGGGTGGAPTARHLLVVDVDESSGVDEIARLLADLEPRILRADTELLAVGDWRALVDEAAALLVRRGVRLVPSAPHLDRGSRRGVPIAVAIGLWLSGSAPGAALEILSEDHAFDTVGEVATSRGAIFRRLPWPQSVARSGAAGGQPTRDQARPKSRRRRRRS